MAGQTSYVDRTRGGWIFTCSCGASSVNAHATSHTAEQRRKEHMKRRHNINPSRTPWYLPSRDGR
ncbi:MULTISPECIES: hypothetical protein [unclassified Streptomyces]|uniref:hypothetical protein n=1 Tax=unclassified Streptomyces TaxID=2593676 RepID=UPI000BF13A70|nr:MULTISPECIES: hypothetical protein [unclassified Streptomyces]